MNHRPETFHDWRKLYNENLRNIGFAAAWLAERDGGVVFIDRNLYSLLHRDRRLKARMEVEREAGTESYKRALFKSIFGRDIADMREEP
jgi:hypothetical protein